MRHSPALPAVRPLTDVAREVRRLASGGPDGGRRARVLVLSDGSSVLSCGDLGAEAVRPVLDRKCEVIEAATGMDAFPLALARAEPERIVHALELLRPNYDAILIVDIAAPRCFALQRLLVRSSIECAVLHDDQQGTAVMAAAVIETAVRRSGRTLRRLCAVVVGAGAAGSSTARLLHHLGVGDLRVVDSGGVLHRDRADLAPEKAELAALTNRSDVRGPLAEALRGADVCVALSGSPVPATDLAGMNPRPIIIPLSYPDVEMQLSDALALRAVYLPALENNLSNNLATPGLLLAAHRLGLRELSMCDLANAVACLTSLSMAAPDPVPVPDLDPVLLAGAIAGAVADGRAHARGNACRCEVAG
jgi:malate dehydrogenase (oxaloacetate-decarboxylating)